jgi:hypothetical protein
VVAGVGLVSGLVACSGNNTYSGGGSTQVVEMRVDNSTILVGEGTVAKINFTFNQNDVLFGGGRVNLVVRVPPQLTYRDDSAEINLPGSKDRNEDPKVTQCPGGETFLVFKFTKSDLENLNLPVDSSDTQLKLTVDGVRVGEDLSIQAAADEGAVSYGCGKDFAFDEEQLLTVESVG